MPVICCGDDGGTAGLRHCSSSLRNSLFFNKTNPKFGLELSLQDRQGKELLTNGFQSRGNLARSAKLRLARRTDAPAGRIDAKSLGMPMLRRDR